MAIANTTMIGPVLGSVPDPVKMPPKPCPVTQKASESTAPAARKRPGRRLRSGPKPMTTASAANTQAHSVPVEDRVLPTPCKKWPYPLGSPDCMPVIALEMDVEVRFCGRRNKTAASDQ